MPKYSVEIRYSACSSTDGRGSPAAWSPGKTVSKVVEELGSELAGEVGVRTN